ncbi:MAG: hypothetical protein IT369_00290 [Candidatus Latescibacteria bacterium]|nr:hypothetical protein [Candidatus Latescibacterota bacterium]
MITGDQLDIRPNPGTGCYEAWLVDRLTGEQRLLATCSLCVPEEQFRWWNRQLGHLLHHELSLSTAA